MKEQKIKLIGLDLDGTTLTTEKILTKHTKEVIEECLKKGIQVLPATGRVKAGIPSYLTEIKGMRYILTSNGASVIDLTTGESIYQRCIPWKRALELFDILENYHTYYDVYSDGKGWCEGRFYDNMDRFGVQKYIKDVVLMSRTRIENLREKISSEQLDVEKINMFFASNEDREKAYRELSKIEDIAVTFSLNNNLEINHIECNKGDALLGLGEILSIPPEQIMACGDGNNDLVMIKSVGLGVAMSNGNDKLKEAADYVTKTNDEEGVAYAIEKFCL